MVIITVLIILAIIGVLMWAINRFIPMWGPIKFLINLIVLVLVVIWLLQLFGFISPIISFPSLR